MRSTTVFCRRSRAQLGTNEWYGNRDDFLRCVHPLRAHDAGTAVRRRLCRALRQQIKVIRGGKTPRSFLVPSSPARNSGGGQVGGLTPGAAITRRRDAADMVADGRSSPGSGHTREFGSATRQRFDSSPEPRRPTCAKSQFKMVKHREDFGVCTERPGERATNGFEVGAHSTSTNSCVCVWGKGRAA